MKCHSCRHILWLCVNVYIRLDDIGGGGPGQVRCAPDAVGIEFEISHEILHIFRGRYGLVLAVRTTIGGDGGGGVTNICPIHSHFRAKTPHTFTRTVTLKICNMGNALES